MRENVHVRAYRGVGGGGGMAVEMLVFQKILRAWQMYDPLFWKISTLKIQKYLTNVPKAFTKTSVKNSIKGERLQNFNV